MRWLKKLLGTDKPPYRQFAENLYDAMVLEGGPSSGSPSHVDAKELGIPLTRRADFEAKRLITLEAFLFVASAIATLPKEERVGPFFGFVTPLAEQLSTVIGEKWRERGIEVAGRHDVGELCFDEVELALRDPYAWGRAWLADYFDDANTLSRLHISWTDQWLKEFKTMQLVVAEYL